VTYKSTLSSFSRFELRESLERCESIVVCRATDVRRDAVADAASAKDHESTLSSELYTPALVWPLTAQREKAVRDKALTPL
jgi:hypothetical protein